jgi:hypothetical protein
MPNFAKVRVSCAGLPTKPTRYVDDMTSVCHELDYRPVMNHALSIS